MDTQRKNTDLAFKYTLYFELLGRKIEQHNADLRHVYNMNEKKDCSPG
jgi:hypothetical protein